MLDKARESMISKYVEHVEKMLSIDETMSRV